MEPKSNHSFAGSGLELGHSPNEPTSEDPKACRFVSLLALPSLILTLGPLSGCRIPMMARSFRRPGHRLFRAEMPATSGAFPWFVRFLPVGRPTPGTLVADDFVRRLPHVLPVSAELAGEIQPSLVSASRSIEPSPATTWARRRITPSTEGPGLPLPFTLRPKCHASAISGPVCHCQCHCERVGTSRHRSG